MAAFLGSLILFFRFHIKKRQTFLDWLAEHKSMLRSGGTANYKDNSITMESKVAHFNTVISLVIYSFKVSSRYYLIGTERRILGAIVFIIATFFLGWWAVPWGPIWTVQEIFRSLMGGHWITVGELMDVLDAQEAEALEEKTESDSKETAKKE